MVGQYLWHAGAMGDGELGQRTLENAWKEMENLKIFDFICVCQKILVPLRHNLN